VRRPPLKHEKQAYTNVLIICAAVAAVILATLAASYEDLAAAPWWAWTPMALPLGVAATATFNHFFPADRDEDGGQR